MRERKPKTRIKLKISTLSSFPIPPNFILQCKAVRSHVLSSFLFTLSQSHSLNNYSFMLSAFAIVLSRNFFQERNISTKSVWFFLHFSLSHHFSTCTFILFVINFCLFFFLYFTSPLFYPFSYSLVCAFRLLFLSFFHAHLRVGFLSSFISCFVWQF